MSERAAPSMMSTTDDPVVAELLEELADRIQAGEAVDVGAFLAQHPGQAERLRPLLPAVQVLAELSRSGSASAAPAGTEADRLPATLGDFRIVREVGRGGMGVVYEAEQLSLGRRVALKVLPFAAAMDPRHLQRFQNEARAAATLHHGNIVPVHAVGQERGVHYYAMQFIEGHTLAALIAALRQAESPPTVTGTPATGDDADFVLAAPGGADATRTYAPPPSAPGAAPAAGATPPPGAFPTSHTAREPAFFRRA